MKKSRRTQLFVAASIICIGLAGYTLFTSRYTVLPANSYNLLPALPAPTSADRILIVSPHPDDETLGTAGYVLQAKAAHASVHIVLATDGNKHGLKDVRHQEIIQAAAKLGLSETDITFLDFPDGNLSGQASFVQKLQTEVDTYHPDILIGTHPQDIHPDHAAVGRAIESVGAASNHTLTAYYFLIHYHRYPRPIGYKPNEYEVPAGRLVTSESHWESLNLTDAQEQTKLAAIQAYRSQISYKNPVLRDLLFSFVRKNEVFAVKHF
jgi:LmbE family N-acetylglucosaminyl deacetylase